jgi:hypothetical protein
MMATLYGVTAPAVNQRLKRIFADRELDEEAVIKHYLTTAADGKSCQVKHYNLQTIIAVGFKIENERAVQFRKWANQIVKDYTIQGWVMDVTPEKRRQHTDGGILRAATGKNPGNSPLRAQVLPEDHRHLRHGAGLRPLRHSRPALLRRRTEQAALRHSRADGSGGDRESRRPPEGI